MWCISELFKVNFKHGPSLLIIFWFFPEKVAILFMNQVFVGFCEKKSLSICIIKSISRSDGGCAWYVYGKTMCRMRLLLHNSKVFNRAVPLWAKGKVPRTGVERK